MIVSDKLLEAASNLVEFTAKSLAESSGVKLSTARSWLQRQATRSNPIVEVVGREQPDGRGQPSLVYAKTQSFDAADEVDVDDNGGNADRRDLTLLNHLIDGASMRLERLPRENQTGNLDQDLAGLKQSEERISRLMRIAGDDAGEVESKFNAFREGLAEVSVRAKAPDEPVRQESDEPTRQKQCFVIARWKGARVLRAFRVRLGRVKTPIPISEGHFGPSETASVPISFLDMQREAYVASCSKSFDELKF